MERTPTHHDAELVLRLYDLRREPVMREHRALILKEFWPQTSAECVDVLRSDHPFNIAYRQVTTYWEMAFMFCKHGTLHPDMLLESSAEGMFLYARIEPYLNEVRTAGNPRNFRNTEWIATETEIGRSIMEFQRARVKKLLAQKAASKA
jgi:hypothetical protein